MRYLRQLAVLIVGLLAGAMPLRAQSSYEQMQTFSSLMNQIRTSYVDSVTYAGLIVAAVDGVLGSLDPHSRFLSRVNAEREMAYENGSLAGTGIVFDEVDGALAVLAVLAKSPGAKAGVYAGDRLLTVNDTSVAGLSSYEVTRQLTGDKGKKVRLLFERGSRLEPDTFRVQLKYDYLDVKAVTMTRMIDPQTAYMRLGGFEFKSSDETEKALKDLRGKGMKRLIIDLRGNPGGYMNELTEIASLFLPKGSLIYQVQGRRIVGESQIMTTKDGSFRDLPMMVLVDEGSASASEALSGALQDHDRALILGRRTFGKALMQRAFPVPPQGDLVWLTVGRIATPSGRIIQRAYHGLKAEQYYSFGGKTGDAQDTSTVFYTDKKRPVRGGGGVAPDVPIPGPVDLPRWWSVASDSGWIEAVADSTAALLPREQTAPAAVAWLATPAQWQSGMMQPMLNRARTRLNITAEPSEAQLARMGRILAWRATEVRWGPDAAELFLVQNDATLKAAMEKWGELPKLLGN
jgi:carboxyl-terminal processing protease